LTDAPRKLAPVAGWFPDRAPRVGIVGAGQLARMLALAAYPLGIQCLLLDREPGSSGAQVAPLLEGAFDDIAALERLASLVDVLTFDIENVPGELLERLAGRVAVHPSARALSAAQDRLTEKRLFQTLGVPTVDFLAIEDAADLAIAPGRLGWPIVLKSRRLGYDGRGQRIARNSDELAAGWAALGSVPAIAEAWVAFERELSLIGVRGAQGETVFYPLAENAHRDGILRRTLAPYLHAELQHTAEAWLNALFDELDYRGVLTVEFFMAGDDLLANEMAPRVHNSGHWTIEGAATSQFENHLRAVLGWPLGDPSPRGHSAMINLLGNLPPLGDLLRRPGVHVHHYGKMPRAKRKIGHCTLLDTDRRRLLDRVADIEACLPADS
jgi:5-(carboxyamino)imidazole ribonucleotide synthase